MSPGNQILALTEKKATPKRSTIVAGSNLVLRKPTKLFDLVNFSFFIEEIK